MCSGPETLTGVDVSYYQGTVDWKKVKAAGRSFAFVRVSDGVDHPDTKFSTNWRAMKTAGITRGFYQFFRPAKDVTAQVNLLVSKVTSAGGLKVGDLPPVLDLESTGGLAASTVVSRAKSWLAKVEAKYHVKPIIYTAAFMSEVIGENFAGYPLWVANYGATCPSMPSGFTDWQFWQDSDSGTVNGVTGKVDTNFFNGNADALAALTIQPSLDARSGEVDDGRGSESEGDEGGGDPGDGDVGITSDETVTYEDGADQGATMGSSAEKTDGETQSTSTPSNPCGR